ncbi:hypothetical protein DL770_009619 [Monosporascus sp. CRB-9-2]|nr:hypothetical protein DL770_009619 [Monosporascus sp. CRB-9-2]
MHGYPTLLREIVTPNLPTFAKACLQILKPPVSSKIVKVPYSLIEAVFEAISTLLPLYPTTLREISAKIKAEARPYLAPTGYEAAIIPTSLQESSRRLVVRLHMTATKSGDAADWAKHIDMLIKEFHMTADQLFRPVHENWESASGYRRGPANFDAEPRGGGDQPESLPPWTGTQAGSERMIGLLHFIGDCLRCHTRSAVAIPISSIVDAIARISSIMPPSPEGAKMGSNQTNPAVGREEKDDFWAVFPDIQLAALRLYLVLIQRLGRNFLPVTQEALDQTLRIFESSYRLPEIRAIAFMVIKELIGLCGPTMEKLTVEGLSLVIKSCCRDLLGAAGHLKRPKQQTSAQNGSKPKTVTQNADAFLSTKTDEETILVSLSEEHLEAAEALLATFFSSLPQQHLASPLRIRMLKTAILCQNKDAQVESVLHPSRDGSGRMPQVILPYLARQFPHDRAVELLRFTFRPLATGPLSNVMGVEDEMLVDEEPKTVAATNGSSFGRSFGDSLYDPLAPSNPPDASEAVERAKSPSPVAPPIPKIKDNPFLPTPTQTQIQNIISEEQEVIVAAQSSNSLKRKNEEEDAMVTKRVEIENAKTAETVPAVTGALSQVGRVSTGQEDEDDSDDESVHLNMVLDSSSDEEGGE